MDSQKNITNNTVEPLLNEENERFTILPIQHQDIWSAYKKHESAIWHAHEVKLDKDLQHWNKMSDDERHFVKYVLAFFASSDMIVNQNLTERFMKDVKVTEAKIFYQFQAMMENIHCVPPETMILTSKGYFPISNLENQQVSVWNGTQYTETIVRLTSREPRDILKVTLSNGAVVESTIDHKWLIKGVDVHDYNNRVSTKDLKIGDILLIQDLPTVHMGHDLPKAYFTGSLFAANSMNKENGQQNKGFYDKGVPLSCNMHSKLEWLAGYLDTKVINESVKSVVGRWFVYDNINILRQIQMLLQTMSISCDILNNRRDYILLKQPHINKLKQLGINTRKMNIIYQETNESINKELKIIKIENHGRKSQTYCFHEKNQQTGMFNGVLTGQSEVYSNMIDTYIKDKDEKEKLFNAVKTIPCIKRKAEWAFKWIESNKGFSERLVAFAAVEGIFFSGAFCCIYWLNEQGKMPGLAQGNDFIARDEGMHTDFACLLYNNHIINKLSQERMVEIITDAVNIETEFITEALPCRLLGMNANLMKEYIKYVANRLVKQLGHEEIYANVKQPFPFMDRISLKNKSNFFEVDPTEYQKGDSSDEDDAYDNL